MNARSASPGFERSNPWRPTRCNVDSHAANESKPGAGQGTLAVGPDRIRHMGGEMREAAIHAGKMPDA